MLSFGFYCISGLVTGVVQIIGIQWSVEKDGQTSVEKVSFYDNNDVWNLYKIEIGGYYPA